MKTGIKFLNRKEINDQIWDDLVSSNPDISHSNYSWFLDSICKNWGAFQLEDQNIYFPVPFLKGIKSKVLYQPIFSRSLSVICPVNTDTDSFNSLLIKEIEQNFKHFHFHSDLMIPDFAHERKYQKITNFSNLEELRKGYSENAKRQIKKFNKENWDITINQNISESIQLMESILGSKIKELKSTEFKILKDLISISIKKEQGQLVNFVKDQKIIITGFFFLRNESLIFIKGADSNEAMKKVVCMR